MAIAQINAIVRARGKKLPLTNRVKILAKTKKTIILFFICNSPVFVSDFSDISSMII